MKNPFSNSPFLVFWETTRACDLVCLHCRACAVPSRDPRELTHEEGCALLRDAGLSRLAMSLDSASAAVHDGFRGVAGSYERTLAILRTARSLGMSTQLNTTLTPRNVDELRALAALARTLDVALWSVFLLVPTGRGSALDSLDAERVETALLELAAIAREAPFDVKTTAAPQFRRILLQQKVARREIVGVADGIGRAPSGVNDGQGIAFVSHTGDIYPSGFLPVSCGNVRGAGLTRIYRTHPLFLSLRDPEQLTGKCGECEFKRVCGGSRARAYAVHGSPLGYDPACAYVPRRTASAEQEPRA